MSGHSHWAGIKHKKAANDAKRGKVWSKVARMIIVAAKNGGGDPAANLTLRYAIDKAKSVNMPKDTIEKAIKKGTGDLGGVHYEEVLYEGYGPNGVAIMVEALTDNRSRTGPEIKRIFEKHGGSLGTTGCVNWMFGKKGLITVATSTTNEDDLLELALGAGADDMQTTGEVFEITCDPSAFEPLKKALEAKSIPIEVAEISMVPQNTVGIDSETVAKRIVSLMEAFDDHDDVQNAYANFDIPDEVMAKVS
ncbi:MAG: YebC/PmpR family DNA-binding transcriptional regulator [Sedimentisphaerales bacterium]|jgi:YebC/PmpR family DNA-binding regulatory protein|nr:YebC/PmpR family DNA-binding transcriptional regulator [Sedimentisphaerales bacterium]NLZ03943.1 YebC/PmpR family DNA-binding transcriptional regulator [Phycisphaerae bacterium]HNY76635.1 YebC/PmpR family DNA-binding transcriptional regulator [Sedimentisphaerales bacterium]HOC61758.1 YebC/PmpR family DNA-binding transcriptional regulator [Sedimentisphaerales bacterium]HOH62590.1 YebC/PmpR family DNA-binding transcriptional regulator [Sedimentisphaerales bacterium]